MGKFATLVLFVILSAALCLAADKPGKIEGPGFSPPFEASAVYPSVEDGGDCRVEELVGMSWIEAETINKHGIYRIRCFSTPPGGIEYNLSDTSTETVSKKTGKALRALTVKAPKTPRIDNGVERVDYTRPGPAPMK